MTKIQIPQADQIDRAHMERLQRCAELGQIVPIDKAKCRKHYEGMLAELQQETRGSAS